MFSKTERSTFKYWFAHWCAYQMTALNLKCWSPRFLLHDIEKPWLRLFLPYKKVQVFHRTHSNHHIEYLYNHKPSKMDWLALVIDWECSRFTKENCQLNARQEMNEHYLEYRDYIQPILLKLGL